MQETDIIICLKKKQELEKYQRNDRMSKKSK